MTFVDSVTHDVMYSQHNHLELLEYVTTAVVDVVVVPCYNSGIMRRASMFLIHHCCLPS